MSEETPVTVGTAQTIRVLIVDDQLLLRQSFQRLLELESDIVVVGVAGNGEEALKRLPDLERSGQSCQGYFVAGGT